MCSLPSTSFLKSTSDRTQAARGRVPGRDPVGTDRGSPPPRAPGRVFRTSGPASLSPAWILMPVLTATPTPVHRAALAPASQVGDRSPGSPLREPPTHSHSQAPPGCPHPALTAQPPPAAESSPNPASPPKSLSCGFHLICKHLPPVVSASVDCFFSHLLKSRVPRRRHASCCCRRWVHKGSTTHARTHAPRGQSQPPASPQAKSCPRPQC